MALTVDYEKDANDFSAIVYGQWNDYNEDGPVKSTKTVTGLLTKLTQLILMKSNTSATTTTDGLSGNWNVFFNSDGLVKTTSIDLTHLYVLIHIIRGFCRLEYPMYESRRFRSRIEIRLLFR